MFTWIVINHSKNSGQLFKMVVLKAIYQREMLVIILSEKSMMLNYRHSMITTSQLSIKGYSWQYIYTIIDCDKLFKTDNTYCPNKKIYDIKAANWKKKRENLRRNLHSQLCSWQTWFPFCMPSGTSFGYTLLLYTVKGKTLVCRNCSGFTDAEAILLSSQEN